MQRKELTGKALKRVQDRLVKAVTNYKFKDVAKIIAEHGDNADVMNACDEGGYHLLRIVADKYKFNLKDEDQFAMWQLLLTASAIDVNWRRELNYLTYGSVQFALIHLCILSSYINKKNKPLFIAALMEHPKFDVNYIGDYAPEARTRNIPLHSLIRMSYVETVKSFLSHEGVNLANMVDSKGSAIHVAFHSQHYHFIPMLLQCIDKGLDPNARDENGKTVLHLALETADTPSDMLALLLACSDISVFFTDANKNNALHFVAKNGYTDCIGTILTKQSKTGEKVSATALNAAGNTPLMLAVKNNQDAAALELFALIDTAPQICDAKGNSVLMFAASSGNLDLVEAYLKHPMVRDEDVNACNLDNQNALHVAAYCGHTEVVKRLLASKRISADNRGINAASRKELATPLTLAAHSGDVEMVKCLLEAGADPLLEDYKRKKASEIALDHNKPAVAKVLIEHELHAAVPNRNVTAGMSMFKPVFESATASNARDDNYRRKPQ